MATDHPGARELALCVAAYVGVEPIDDPGAFAAAVRAGRRHGRWAEQWRVEQGVRLAFVRDGGDPAHLVRVLVLHLHAMPVLDLCTRKELEPAGRALLDQLAAGGVVCRKGSEGR